MAQPALEFIATKNHKNLSSKEKVCLNKLNIFIGSNGSGKSNLISCLKFLKDCLTTTIDENRGVSSLEHAASNIGSSRMLDVNVTSPAPVDLNYGFSGIDQSNNVQKGNAILSLGLYNVFCFCSISGTHFSIKSLSRESLNDQLNEGWQLGDLYRVADPTVGGWPW